MPELPEVETVMRGLLPVMQDQIIRNVWCGEKGLRIPFPDGLKERVAGQRITALSRRAKYIVITLDHTHVLVLHLGMSGRIRIIAPNVPSHPEKHDHFSLTLDKGHRIILNDARRFGMVFDVPLDNIDTHKAFAHLGPEPFSQDFHTAYLKEALRRKTTAIKVALMNQELVVGVGNIYACEALFRSGISPIRPVNSLSSKELTNLIAQIQETLQEAIQAGGSTLKDHRLPDGNFGYFQQKLFVYGRKGTPCLTCDTPIDHLRQAGRSTFYCAQCQR